MEWLDHVSGRHGTRAAALYLLLVLPVRRVQRLDQIGGVAQEHGVAGSAHDHADHGQPDVSHALGGVGAIPDTEHVAHGHEKGVGVLDVPGCILGTQCRNDEDDQTKI